VICTYNPDPNTFRKCIRSIVRASEVYAPQEIIIVDNNSIKPVSELDCIVDLLNGSIPVSVVQEVKQGLTPARIRGIKLAAADLILFVDDDNFIEEDFFKRGAEIALRFPFIGAWSGQVKIVYDKQPEEWTRRYWGLLVHRQFSGERWSNFPHLPETMPCGAGLFVRRNVADYYMMLHDRGQRHVQLDRTGSSLFSGGDNDLAACACDIGLGVGLFDSLKLDHYIPESRFGKGYLLRLAEGIAASGVVFRSFRGEMPEPLTSKKRIANSIRAILMSGLEREFFRAVLKGEEAGTQLVSTGRGSVNS
jgi:glycosyltransferase involved in cell wall biosynthesis